MATFIVHVKVETHANRERPTRKAVRQFIEHRLGPLGETSATVRSPKLYNPAIPVSVRVLRNVDME